MNKSIIRLDINSVRITVNQPYAVRTCQVQVSMEQFPNRTSFFKTPFHLHDHLHLTYIATPTDISENYCALPFKTTIIEC